LSQTWKNYYLLVIFDRNKVDGNFVRHIKAEFDDQHIQWCNLFPADNINNWSGTDARNFGIDSGTSPWIAYIDDDDRWMPEHLETLVEMSDNGGNMLHTGGAMVQYRLRHPQKRERIRRRVSYHNEPMTVGMAHTKSLFKKTPGWKPIENHDSILWQDMISAGGNPVTNSKTTFEFLR
jgi:glycosyltransferase involved in cell wall biosynthesis